MNEALFDVTIKSYIFVCRRSLTCFEFYEIAKLDAVETSRSNMVPAICIDMSNFSFSIFF